MSDAISRRIKQLESQNQKFKRLLESTLQITCEDSAKCEQLKNEANYLKKALSDLENQKKQLEEELKPHLIRVGGRTKGAADVNIRYQLNNTLNDIQRESVEFEHLKTDDEYLKEVITNLEQEKEQLMNNIRLVQKVNEENNNLVEENVKLKQELALLQAECAKFSVGLNGQDLIKKISSLENMRQTLQANIKVSKANSNPLGNPVENTVLELKISGLEKQKENIIKYLRANLLQSATEVSMLYSDTSDLQLRGLLNELDIHKTILMMNLNDVKEMHDLEKKEKCIVADEDSNNNNIKEEASADQQSDDTKRFVICNKEEPLSSTTSSSETIQEVIDIREAEAASEDNVETKSQEDLTHQDQDRSELSTVSEEDEAQLAEHELLKQEVNRLERERSTLLKQIKKVDAHCCELFDNVSRVNFQTRSELYGTLMREESLEAVQKLPLDDATNQIYGNEGQLLAQRMRELEEENERIRRDLSLMLEETQSDKEDLEVLEEGKRLIRDHK